MTKDTGILYMHKKISAKTFFLLISSYSLLLFLVNCSSVNNTARNPVFEWKYKTNFHIISSPAVDSDGNIYFGSQDKHIYALNQNGKLIWKKQLGSKVNSSPTLIAGKLYVGSQDTYLYILNMSNGDILKRYKTNDSIHASTAIDEFGNIYFGSYDGFFYALNPDTTLKWKFKTNGIIDSSPAIDDKGIIYIASTDGNVYAFNSSSNVPLWTFSTQDKITASPAIGQDNIVYIGSFDGHVYAIYPDGTEKWKFKTDNKITSSAAITSDNTIVFGSLDKHLYAISEDGTLLWKRELRGQISSSPAITKGNFIFIGSYDYHVYMIRAEDGSINWTYNLNDFIISSPTITKNGNLYVTSMDYSMYAFKIYSKGYTASPWPGFGAGNMHTGVVQKNLAENIAPLFQIAKTDTVKIKSQNTEKNATDTVSNNYPRSKVISSIKAESQSFVYTYNLDLQSTSIELTTIDTTNGKILDNKIIDTPLSNLTSPLVFKDINTITVGDKNIFLGLSSLEPKGISASSINTNGEIIQQSYIDDTLLYEINDPIDMANITIDGTTYVYVLGHDDNGLSAFQVLEDTDTTLLNIFNIDNVENYNYALDSPTQIITTTIYNTPFLFVSSAVESGISLFRINTNGTLTYTDSVFDIQNKDFYIRDINSMALLSGAGTTYLVTASDVENGISIFSISSTGILASTTHINFNEHNFDIQQLGYISSLNIDNTYYLVVYEQSQISSNIFTINNENNISQFINDRTFQAALNDTTTITDISTNTSDTLLVFAKEKEIGLYKIVR